MSSTYTLLPRWWQCTVGGHRTYMWPWLMKVQIVFQHRRRREGIQGRGWGHQWWWSLQIASCIVGISHTVVVGDDTTTICDRATGCMWSFVIFGGHCLALSPTLRPIVVDNLSLLHLHFLDLLYSLYLLYWLGLSHKQRWSQREFVDLWNSYWCGIKRLGKCGLERMVCQKNKKAARQIITTTSLWRVLWLSWTSCLLQGLFHIHTWPSSGYSFNTVQAED